MLKGWLRGHAPITTSKSLNSINELAQIQDAMSSVTYIMDDDLEAAEEHLNKGKSPFHQLGVGVCTFMRATLGFEQDVMREASNALYQAECSAYECQKRAARDSNAYRSPIYPPGTEYAVCQAEAQLMSSVVGLLNENITEAIKSFYKLRKAYLALEQVMESERAYLAKKGTSTGSAGSGASTRPSSVKSKTGSLLKGSRPGSTRGASSQSIQGGAGVPAVTSNDSQVKEKSGDDSDIEFVDATENKSGSATPGEYMGHINVTTADGQTIAVDNVEKKIDLASSSASGLPASTDNPSSSIPSAVADFEKLTLQETTGGTTIPDLSEYSDHPVDAFILAGSNFCFGMLLLMLSFIPPSFAMLLKIIGFKGDRERGMKMLWQATNFNDIHGAMSGIVLLGYMNGYTSLCDMIPSQGDGAYPKERCKTLLRGMRQRYPKSHLWLLEESRMLAVDGELEKAVEFVEAAGASPLKQLEALSWFERSLNNMYMHSYEDTAHAFRKCIELNNWSHGLYYYICGASYVELYRKTKDTDSSAATVYAEKAKENFTQVIPNTGKKRFMGRQLPFDIFVSRKIQKWEARAKEWSCEFVDAIGVSPLEEMIFFWNGYKRMRPDHLHTSLENLAWSESPSNPHWDKEGLDEKSILHVLRAATLRNLGRTTEAKALLEREVLPVDRSLFKGNLRDSWTAPAARYEMAANLWREADERGDPGKEMEKLEKCRDWLVEVSGWEGYDLDARIGIKVTNGKNTLRKFGVQC